MIRLGKIKFGHVTLPKFRFEFVIYKTLRCRKLHREELVRGRTDWEKDIHG